MALVTIVAQKKAGKGKTPSAAQVTAAEAVVHKKLAASGTTVKGGEPTLTMGCIKGRLLGNQMAGTSDDSGSFWDSVKSIALKASPILKSAIPGAAAAVPVAMLTARATAKSAAAKEAKATAQKTIAEDKAKNPPPSPSPTEEEQPVNEGTVQQAGMRGDDSLTVPHNVYRAEICRRAKILCKGGTPTAECMAKAQASVHADMKKTGVKVSIPGAAPGRVTAGPSSSMMR